MSLRTRAPRAPGAAAAGLRTRLLRVLGTAGVLAVAGGASAALLTGSAAAPAVALAADCPQPPPSSQTSQTFAYTGYNEQFAVPQWVDTLTVTVRGGHGGSSAGNTATAGRPGVVTGVVPVTPGSCLDVVVGAYGGGFGNGSGGAGGYMSGGGLAPRAGGGGGGSSIAPLGGGALVVAGGGGGGGANGIGADDPDQGTPGGAGGDGANGLGPGTPQGEAGTQPPHGHPDLNMGPAEAGQPDQGSGGNGADGIHWEFVETLCGNLSGGGGGGGGGYRGGGAGRLLIPEYANPDNQQECLAGFGFGGGGGAGGDSYAAPSVQSPTFTVDPGACPFDGASNAQCWGEVQLDWSVDVAGIAPAGGSRQTASIGSRYPGLLQARVTARDGAPIPGLAVTFALPGGGPSATFETGDGNPRSLTITTDDSGVATAPPLIANDAVGAFAATATVAGVRQPARFSLTNQAAATATSLWTVPANPSVTLEPVRFVAQVRQAPSTAPTPVGVVSFQLAGTQIAVVSVDSLGTAISEPVALPAGSHPVKAIYYPDDQFRASQAALSQRVDRASTAVEITSSRNPSADGDAVSFTATVAPVAPGAGTPTGAVTFTVDDRALGGPVQLSGGRAQSATIALAAGRHEVEASYEGDPGYELSDGSFVQSVGAAATATILTASPRNPVVGQAAQITATVLPPAARSSDVPVGGVDVYVDGVLACDGVTLVGGSATCAVTAPPLPGPHEITAEYEPGSPDFDASDGALSQRVAPGRVQVQLEATPDPSVFGEAVRLHAQVGAAAPASGAPSGAVTFTVDGAPVGQPVLLRDGRADSVAIPRLGAGPHVLRASYSGDASFAPNAIGATQAVDRGQTLGTITSSAPDTGVGAAPRYTLRLAVAAPAAGEPGGLVQFSVDGAPWGPPVAVEHGSAVSAPVGGLRAGAHLVRAAYLGASGFERIDAQLTQWIRSPDAPRPPGGGSGGQGGGTDVPTITPASRRSPLACAQPLVLTAAGVHGRRVRIAGVAQADYAGQRVAIESGGRVLARPRVAADGSFSAHVARPRRGAGPDTMYVATAGSARSAAVALEQQLRISQTRSAGARRIRLRAVLTGAPRVTRIRVERQIACGRTAVVARPRVQSARGSGGARRIEVTIARPTAGQGAAAIRLRAGRRIVSLPVLVQPGSR